MGRTISPTIILALAISAQAPAEVLPRQITRADGERLPAVFSIVQDRAGLIWIGTINGLLRYDGYRFKEYRYDPDNPGGLRDDNIKVLTVGADGMLWIGTDGGGLHRLNPRTGEVSFWQHDPKKADALSNNSITAIVEGHDGNLWVGTRNGGLNGFDKESGTFIHWRYAADDTASLPHDNVHALLLKDSTSLLIATAGGLARLHLSSGALERIQNQQLQSAGFLSRLLRDRNGVVWIGSAAGLIRYDVETNRATPWPLMSRGIRPSREPAVRSLYEDRSGRLWIGTQDGTVGVLDPSRTSCEWFGAERGDMLSARHGDTGNPVLTIMEDGSGLMWVGGMGGAQTISLPRGNFRRMHELPGNKHRVGEVYAIHRDREGWLWLGTIGELIRWHPVTKKVQAYQDDPDNPRSLSSNAVLSVWEGSDRAVWVGTFGGGLNRLAPATGEVKRWQHDPNDPQSLSHHWVFAVREDRHGRLWVGTQRGLNLINRTTGSFFRFVHDPGNPKSLSHNQVTCIYEDSGGDIWVGTNAGGLNRVLHSSSDGTESASVSFTHFVHDPADRASLSHNTITTISEDGERNLWVGTEGGGLCMLDRQTGTFKRYLKKDGLAGNVVFQIVPDKRGRMWVSTEGGLSRLDLATGRLSTYGETDGLGRFLFNLVGYHDPAAEVLYFAGTRGILSFHPDSISEGHVVPPIVLTDFRIFNERMPFSDYVFGMEHLELRYPQNSFSFEFSVLEYSDPRQKRYQYMLEGFDETWVYSEDRNFASYTNVPAGSYVFRVKGGTHTGGWNEDGTSVSIAVLPPFWGTWWFRVGAILSVVLLTGLMYRRRVGALKHERAIQEEMSRRLIQLQESERKRIASGLHDSLGQNLLVLKNALQQASTEPKVDPETRNELHSLSELAQQSLDEVREISFDLHPHVLDRLGLRKAIETVVDKFSQRSSLVIAAEFDGVPERFPETLEMGVYRIAQECLSNIVKHSGASDARISLSAADGSLRMSITDNGKGFDASEYAQRPPQQRSLGLLNIAERVRLLGGTHSIDSAPGKGTSIMVNIPLSRDRTNG
jgi:signal transduction histidine kinase/ligand-binding sensor domain-containing protein